MWWGEGGRSNARASGALVRFGGRGDVGAAAHVLLVSPSTHHARPQAASKRLAAGLEGREPVAVILDDSSAAWPHDRRSLLVAERYVFLPTQRATARSAAAAAAAAASAAAAAPAAGDGGSGSGGGADGGGAAGAPAAAAAASLMEAGRDECPRTGMLAVAIETLESVHAQVCVVTRVRACEGGRDGNLEGVG